MFAVNVQSVSVQQMNAYIISQFTQTSNSFAVVNVVNGSKANIPLCHISRDVLNDCHLISINVHVYMYLLFILRHLCCDFVLLYFGVLYIQMFGVLFQWRWPVWKNEVSLSFPILPSHLKHCELSSELEKTLCGVLWAENHAFSDTKSKINHLLVSLYANKQ